MCMHVRAQHIQKINSSKPERERKIHVFKPVSAFFFYPFAVLLDVKGHKCMGKKHEASGQHQHSWWRHHGGDRA